MSPQSGFMIMGLWTFTKLCTLNSRTELDLHLHDYLVLSWVGAVFCALYWLKRQRRERYLIYPCLPSSKLVVTHLCPPVGMNREFLFRPWRRVLGSKMSMCSKLCHEYEIRIDFGCPIFFIRSMVHVVQRFIYSNE